MNLTRDRMRSIGWAALLVICAALTLVLMVRVNAVKSEVQLAQRQINAIKQEKLILETEFLTRASQQQLRNLNAIEFGYQAPTAGLVAKLGYIYNPEYPFWFVDHELDDICRMIGRYVCVDVDVSTAPLRPSKTPAAAPPPRRSHVRPRVGTASPSAPTGRRTALPGRPGRRDAPGA